MAPAIDIVAGSAVAVTQGPTAADTILVSDLRCPACGAIHTETMPTNACTIRFPCSCGHVIRPKPGDCCVFCSHGSVPCPPIQEARRIGESGCCA